MNRIHFEIAWEHMQIRATNKNAHKKFIQLFHFKIIGKSFQPKNRKKIILKLCKMNIFRMIEMQKSNTLLEIHKTYSVNSFSLVFVLLKVASWIHYIYCFNFFFYFLNVEKWVFVFLIYFAQHRLWKNIHVRYERMILFSFYSVGYFIFAPLSFSSNGKWNAKGKVEKTFTFP